MNDNLENLEHSRLSRRVLFLAACLATLVAIFYAEEKWRGKRAWENCRRELEAKGASLDWASYIPPTVPDEQNIFKAPKMAEWFVREGFGPIASQRGTISKPLAGVKPWPSGKTNPVLVAELKVASLGTEVISERAGAVWRMGSTAAREQAQQLLHNLLGQSTSVVRGFLFFAHGTDQIKPAQVTVEADEPPTVEKIRGLFPSNSDLPGPTRLVVKANGSDSFQVWLSPPDFMAASDYLAWSDQSLADLDLIRSGLKRPYARMDGDYQQPFAMPIPNFIAIRTVAQALAERAQCYLLLDQPEQALAELTLFHDMSRLLKAEPTGKPMSLVAAMINVAITGLYASIIADGLRLQAWREPQLTALEQQLKDTNLLIPFVGSFDTERAGLCRTLEATERGKLFSLFSFGPTTFWDKFKHPEYLLLQWGPRGWVFQNMVTVASVDQKLLEGIDLPNNRVLPHAADDVTREMQTSFRRNSPYTFLAAHTIPNYLKASQTLARNQTMVNEALIACALERYRLEQGQYPETLDALVRRFTDKLPHDLINGEPLKYRKTADGKFTLYSVGWNEKDDGGIADKAISEGDWVWQTSKL